jgi:hypothetical protein
VSQQCACGNRRIHPNSSFVVSMARNDRSTIVHSDAAARQRPIEPMPPPDLKRVRGRWSQKFAVPWQVIIIDDLDRLDQPSSSGRRRTRAIERAVIPSKSLESASGLVTRGLASWTTHTRKTYIVASSLFCSGWICCFGNKGSFGWLIVLVGEAATRRRSGDPSIPRIRIFCSP